MAIPDQFLFRIEAIRKDRASGAARLAVRAAAMLVECSQASPEHVGELAHELSAAQPAMGPMFNLTRRVLACSDVPAACHEFLESMERVAEQVAANAAALIQDGMTLMTHSFSSTVLAACREAYRNGRRFSVICPESRPVCEGVALAVGLGSGGIQASVITDAAIYRCLPGAQLVCVGADAISQRGVFNKTGTSLLAMAAHERGVPVYVLCGSDKFLPASYDPPPEEPKNPAEILDLELPHITALNYYFDLTPLTYVTGVVTERGILSPAALGEQVG